MLITGLDTVGSAVGSGVGSAVGSGVISGMTNCTFCHTISTSVPFTGSAPICSVYTSPAAKSAVDRLNSV